MKTLRTITVPSRSKLARDFPAGHGCVVRDTYCDIVGLADQFLTPGCLRVRDRRVSEVHIVHHSKVTLAL